MGETRNIIMVHVRSTLLFAAILVFVSGLPHGADEYQQASTEINMLLQQGKDQSACADLAKTLVDEVTASVKLSNKLLADLHDGSSCPSEGQKAVKAAQRNKDAADKAAREAATAASKASGAEIDFGAYSLSSLTEDKCGQFWENKAYKSAKAAAAAADSAKTTADAKAKAAARALDDETKAAAEAVKACQCQVRKSYDSAWTAANKNNEANQASYTKGKHMECVLEGRAAAEGDAGDAPKPNPVTMGDGVPAEPCAETGDEGDGEGDVGYKFFRFNVLKNNGGFLWAIREVKFYGVGGTSLSLDPSRASASSQYSHTNGPSKAFEGGTTQYFSANTQKTGWLQISFPTPTVVKSYSLTRSDLVTMTGGQITWAQGNPFTPKDWNFAGSNDGATWDILDSRRNINDWNDNY